MTKEERSAYGKQYKQAKAAELRIKNAEYRKANKYAYNQWCKDNPDKIKTIKKKSYLKNRETIIAQKRDYYQKNKIEINQKILIKRKTNPLFKLKAYTRNLIRKALFRNGYIKNSKTIQILGCSFEEFKTHLESLFESWMNWDNYGRYNGKLNYGWDIDHIIPLSTTKTEEDVVRLNHYSNLQPLCSYTNRCLKRDLI